MKKIHLAIILLAVYLFFVVIIGFFAPFGSLSCFPESTSCQSYSPTYTAEFLAVPAAIVFGVYVVLTKAVEDRVSNSSNQASLA